MRALVTGGAGFIGSHLVDALLEHGNSVTVLDDFSSGSEHNLKHAKALAQKSGQVLEIIRGKIEDPKVWEELERHDAVFHLAAQTSVTESVKNTDHDFKVNVQSFVHIVNWIRQKQVRILLYTGSAGTLYGNAQSFPTDERHAIGPSSPYGATKAFGEIYISALTRALKDAGEWSSRFDDGKYFTWASMRLANVYGPRQLSKGEAGVIPIFIDAIAQGKQPTLFGDGKKTRDYVYVLDVVAAFMATFEKMKLICVDDAFNVATSIETFDIDVFDTVLDALHARARAPASPASLKRAISVNEPTFSKIRPGELTRSCLNVNKIEAYLGWRPKMDFQKGVSETVNSYPIS